MKFRRGDIIKSNPENPCAAHYWRWLVFYSMPDGTVYAMDPNWNITDFYPEDMDNLVKCEDGFDEKTISETHGGKWEGRFSEWVEDYWIKDRKDNDR